MAEAGYGDKEATEVKAEVDHYEKVRERHHNDRFRDLMDRLMPHWRLHREELNRAPLAHEEWLY